MGLYRKKPVVIQAFKWMGDGNLVGDPQWIWDARNKGEVHYNVNLKSLEIKTLEGKMLAQPGDWIIKGLAGEIYPCKSEIFEQSYELVSN